MVESEMKQLIEILLHFILSIPLTVVGVFETVLFKLVRWYDVYFYTPLFHITSPIVELVPRTVQVGKQQWTIFNANIVSWTRCLLVIPVAFCLKYGYPWATFWCIVLHDFLDHLDGIVARVQKRVYGELDDPLLGGFMDAFCDKVVNVLSLWSILMVTDFSSMTAPQSVLFFLPCAIIIAYEFTIGVIRVQDYFLAYYLREFKGIPANAQSSTSAVMEGKLKEKLESIGIACLGLAQGPLGPMRYNSAYIGVVCMILSIRLAHASLSRKLKARSKLKEEIPTSEADNSSDQITRSKGQGSDSASKASHLRHSTDSGIDEVFLETSDSSENISSKHHSAPGATRYRKSNPVSRSFSSTEFPRVDKVYSIGCFDLFHQGHVNLLTRMRGMGKQLIIGVHDSRSYFKLKKKLPIDSTQKRMMNVKQYADQVYCVANTDPSNFLYCAVHILPTETALYIRGDDMPDFPAREICEQMMPVHFLSYTPGISSTKLRSELFKGEKVLDFDDAHLFY